MTSYNKCPDLKEMVEEALASKDLDFISKTITRIGDWSGWGYTESYSLACDDAHDILETHYNNLLP